MEARSDPPPRGARAQPPSFPPRLRRRGGKAKRRCRPRPDEKAAIRYYVRLRANAPTRATKDANALLASSAFLRLASHPCFFQSFLGGGLIGLAPFHGPPLRNDPTPGFAGGQQKHSCDAVLANRQRQRGNLNEITGRSHRAESSICMPFDLLKLAIERIPTPIFG